MNTDIPEVNYSTLKSNVLIQDEDDEIDYDGWLYKKSPSRFVTQYQERYCVLRRGLFSYSKKADSQEPQGVLSVSSIVLVRPFNDKPDCCEFEMKVSSGRVFVFRAETNVTCCGWMQAIINAKHTDAIVISELENVRVRSVTTQRVINYDKFGSDIDARVKQVKSELKCLFPNNCSPGEVIAAGETVVRLLCEVEKDCRADADVGRPMRPDVLRFYLDHYKEAFESNVLPLLREKGLKTSSRIDVERLSNKYLSKITLGNNVMKIEDVAKKKTSPGKSKNRLFTGLDGWLFGDDVNSNNDTGSREVHDDNEDNIDTASGSSVPVLFTLSMSDLRSLIQVMYGYQNMLLRIENTYKTQKLPIENILWQYMPVVVDAYIDGSDGARVQMCKLAELALKKQVSDKSNAVKKGIKSYYTYTPSDIWESLNAHAEIAGSDERLQLKVMAVIAGVVFALIRSIVDNCSANDDWTYVCAVVNDCSQHVESLDSLVDHISSDAVKRRVEDTFQKLGASVYESATKCCDVLVKTCFDDCLAKEVIPSLFVHHQHMIPTMTTTIEDFLTDFKDGMIEFYFAKLTIKFLTRAIVSYLERFIAAVRKYKKESFPMNRVTTYDLEEDKASLKRCFVKFTGEKLVDDCLLVFDELTKMVTLPLEELPEYFTTLCAEKFCGDHTTANNVQNALGVLMSLRKEDGKLTTHILKKCEVIVASKVRERE